jgi:hypothetical protein
MEASMWWPARVVDVSVVPVCHVWADRVCDAAEGKKQTARWKHGVGGGHLETDELEIVSLVAVVRSATTWAEGELAGRRLGA